MQVIRPCFSRSPEYRSGKNFKEPGILMKRCERPMTIGIYSCWSELILFQVSFDDYLDIREAESSLAERGVLKEVGSQKSSGPKPSYTVVCFAKNCFFTVSLRT